MPGSDPPVPLSMRLFGPLEVRVSGAPLPRLRSRKGGWLLALLALRAGREVDRAWLAHTLWPESPALEPLAAVRRSLTDLRRALGLEAARLHSPTRQALQLDLTGAEVDVLAFDQAVAHGDTPALEQAVALYRGPLLEDCAEEWVFPERQAREQAYLAALESLAERRFAAGDPAGAERYLRRAVTADPTRESAQRALMGALAASGNVAAALLCYRELRSQLHRQWNAEPDPATSELFAQLRAQARAVRDKRPASAVRHRPPAPSSPPAAAIARSYPHRLPTRLTRFIGREQETATVGALLAGSRLLTLTGAGGCGKSRLALEAASAAAPSFPNGVWLVELAALADPARLPEAVAAVLEVREEPGQPLLETLTAFLQAKAALLVLDNCEHLLTPCASMAETLLRAAPGLRILATSREPLGVAGEQRYRVPSLSLPPEAGIRGSVFGVRPDPIAPNSEHRTTNAEHLLASEAVQLFVDRALLHEPGFQWTAESGAAVARICHQLDGIPLAIELAAAWVAALPVAEITRRLEDRLSLLASGSRTVLPRHWTLRASIDWSYDLLTEPERVLWRRLSVFVGGWTVEAAEAACSDGASPAPQIQAEAVVVLLASLVEKSLVVYEPREGQEARYRLLETIREYGRERLEESGEEAATRQRHAHCFTALAEHASSKWHGPTQGEWLARLERELDNVRAALAWATEQDEGDMGVRLAQALCWFWQVRGFLREGREWLAAVLALPGAAGHTTARARTLAAAGELAWCQGEYAAARACYEESLAVYREQGDRSGIAHQYNNLGRVAERRGEWGAARSLYEESLAIHREVGDEKAVAGRLNNLGNVAASRGEYATARTLYEQSLAGARTFGDDQHVAGQCNNLGLLALLQGEYEEARALLEESLTINRKLGNRQPALGPLNNLGTVALLQGKYEEARGLFEQSLAICRELGDLFHTAGCLEGLAGLAGAPGAGPRGAERAARLFGAAEALREQIGAPDRQAGCEQHVAAVQAALDAAVFGAAWAAGQAMPLEAAIACALEEDAGPEGLLPGRSRAGL